MNWKEIVRNVAPTIGAALGGPFAGAATKFVADKLLLDGDAAKLEDYFATATPEQLAKLKELDQQFAVEMKRLDVDVFALEVSDKASARDLAKFDMRPHMALSALFVVGYFSILYGVVSGGIEIADNIKDMTLILIGILSREMPTIFAFWFGSSLGSKLKDEMKS